MTRICENEECKKSHSHETSNLCKACRQRRCIICTDIFKSRNTNYDTCEKCRDWMLCYDCGSLCPRSTRGFCYDCLMHKSRPGEKYFSRVPEHSDNESAPASTASASTPATVHTLKTFNTRTQLFADGADGADRDSKRLCTEVQSSSASENIGSIPWRENVDIEGPRDCLAHEVTNNAAAAVNNDVVAEAVNNDVLAEAVNNDVVAEAVNNDVVAEAVNNDIVAEAVNNDVAAEAVNNDVAAEAVNNDVVAEAVNNDIVAEAVNNDVAAEAVNNDVVAEAVNPDVVAEAVNPDVVAEAVNNEIIERRTQFLQSPPTSQSLPQPTSQPLLPQRTHKHHELPSLPLTFQESVRHRQKLLKIKNEHDELSHELESMDPSEKNYREKRSEWRYLLKYINDYKAIISSQPIECGFIITNVGSL
jgi:hypothetical protein